MLRLRSTFIALALGLVAATASAQVTPAAGFTPPDDTPSVTVGATIFTNFSDQTQPNITDADGNSVKKTSFEIARSYININGRISHVVLFRITPDVARGGGVTGSSAASDSLVFRLKYAYLQTNFDDWMTRGSYAKLGMQQTPYLDYTEGIYRYRFQGTMFTERNNYFASADLGAGFYYNFPSNYGGIHIGWYNGENYQKPEVNDQKAIMVRATVRPFATGDPVLRGLRLTGFYDTDHYIKSDERKRAIAQVTFEHTYANVGFEYLSAKDQTLASAADVESKGWSLWATPKKPMMDGSSWEMLLRYDHLTPNTDTTTFAPASTSPNVGVTVLNDQMQNRLIAGVAYWFPHTGGPTSALLIDYDGQSFKDITTTPNHTIALHALINF